MKTWGTKGTSYYLASEYKSHRVEIQNNWSITGGKLDDHSALFTNSCHDIMATPRLLEQECGIL